MTANRDKTLGVDAALDPFRHMLEQDGYTLQWTPEGGQGLSVHITAGPDACAECLVPKPMMEAILGQALEPTGYEVARIVLPSEDRME